MHPPVAGAVELSRCPVCGGAALVERPAPTVWIADELFGRYRGTFGVRACAACSFEFANPRPDDALLDEFYGRWDYEHHEPAAAGDARAHHILDFVAPT